MLLKYGVVHCKTKTFMGILGLPESFICDSAWPKHRKGGIRGAALLWRGTSGSETYSVFFS